jgi:multidrug resistance efflux pump
VVAAAGAALYWQTRTANSTTGKGITTVVHTAGIIVGDVQRSIRVTGTIQAEKFSTIMAPQLRGSRSDRYRTFSASTSSSPSAPSAPSTPASPATPTTTTSTIPTSTNSTAASSIGATRGTTNRFSDMSGSSTKGGDVSARATSSAAVTSSNLGSTGANLLTPSRGSGGYGADFTFVLLKVAPAGSHVKAGDQVAEFDRQYQLMRLDDYKASVAQHEANIQKLKSDQAVTRYAHTQSVFSAKSDWEKARLDLETIPVRSAIESEEFKLSELETGAHYREIAAEAQPFDTGLKSDLRRSELDRDQAKIELARAQAGVDRMVLKAPIDGIVVMQTIFRGGDFGQVQQGDQISAGMVFMTIVDPASMVLNATVNQVDSEGFRVGMKATVHLDAYPDVELPATVAAVGAMTDGGGWRANWVRSVPIRLKLDRVDPRVIPDLSGSADVVLAEEKQAAVAPLESIFRDGPHGRPFAYVEAPTGFERRDVELGLSSNLAVVVRSGLRKGEVVALSRPASAAPEPARTP